MFSASKGKTKQSKKPDLQAAVKKKRKMVCGVDAYGNAWN